MRSFGRPMLVAAAVALVVVGGAIGGGSKKTVSATYTVGSLTVPGVTGFVVPTGQVVTVTGSGSFCPFGAFGPCFGPGGNPGSTASGGFVLPGAPAWGLVGRVGSGPWVHIGVGPTTLSGSGALQFAVNDDLLADNTGGFTVTASYSCWPGWGYGDKNHTHCGPPGLAKKPQPVSGLARQSQQAATSHGKSAAAHEARGNSGDAHADPGREEGKPRGKSGK